MEIPVEQKDVDHKKYAVGIQFKPCGKVYNFDPGKFELREGNKVVVESMFGLTIGTVVFERIEQNDAQREIKTVVRKATEKDMKTVEDNKSLEADTCRFCLERIAARGLPMKLVATESTLDRRRIIFYFTADGRIDFRELVKDLASKFKTRIEMRQIGVRDEAKLMGGVGICGRSLCCGSFLTSFAPISIRMAKEQELVLNTSKLSGVCGRLMCCLGYEYEGQLEGEIDEEIPREGGCLCEECPADVLTARPSEDVPGDSQEAPLPEPKSCEGVADVLPADTEKELKDERERPGEKESGDEKQREGTDAVHGEQGGRISAQRENAEGKAVGHVSENRPQTASEEKKRFKKKKGRGRHRKKKHGRPS
jgi:cell fate regulator YaaT (PSP1 superfamily)